MPATPHDFRRHEQPALAVDIALVSIVEGALKVLVQKRTDAARVKGDWALPGGIVRIDETLEDTVRRVLAEKTGLKDVFVEQLQTFSQVDRDPRGRVVSVAYYALTPAEIFLAAARRKGDLAAADLHYLGEDARGPIAQLRDRTGHIMSLAFDHARIAGTVVHRLRGKLDYSAVGLELLPPRFTLRDLQTIHETLLGTALNKPAFRRKLLDRGLVRPTGKHETGKAFRPAELYERANPGDRK